MRGLSLACLLAYSFVLGSRFAARSGELDSPFPKSKKGVALCAELVKTKEAYKKRPVDVTAKAFQVAVFKCLWDAPEKMVAEQALVSATDIRNYYAREGLLGFKAKFVRAFSDERTDLRRETWKQVKLALLDIDAEFHFELGDRKDIRQVRRTSVGSARFLRGQYWLQYDDRDVASRIVRKLALVRHQEAAEALQGFLRQVDSGLKIGPSTYAKGEFKELIGRAIALNALVRKHELLADALGEALCSKDTKLISWALEEGRRLKREVFYQIVLKALKHQRKAYTFRNEACRKVAVRLLLDVARQGGIEVPEASRK